jgi:hypothetical protein
MPPWKPFGAKGRNQHRAIVLLVVVLASSPPGLAGDSPPSQGAKCLAAAFESLVSAGRGRLLRHPVNKMQDAGGFGLMLQAGTWGSLDQIWEQVGLQPEFRQRFPRDADFWKSDRSFEQIFEELKRGPRKQNSIVVYGPPPLIRIQKLENFSGKGFITYFTIRGADGKLTHMAGRVLSATDSNCRLLTPDNNLVEVDPRRIQPGSIYKQQVQVPRPSLSPSSNRAS